ncbi:MAG TPA: hypothetical protein VFD29_05595 [Gillisia sp.]|nr:hypothetical protein [Gillisia sp.]
MKGIGILILFPLLVFTLNMNAQRRFNDNYNRLGIQAGITHGGIDSDNFNTSPKTSYMAGLTTRASFYRNFLIIYGVNFYEFRTGLTGYETILLQSPTEIDFNVTGVQLNLFLGTKIFGEYLSIEAGPVLQINSKMTTEDRYKNYFVEDYNLQAEDLEDISKINLNLAANISAGIRDVKFWIQYQYGVNNIFKGLNTKELENKDSRATNLKANMGFATAGIVVYL